MKEQLYMMDAGYSMSSCGKWQRKIFDFAKRYDHHLFTEDGILHLAARMEREGRLAPLVSQNSVSITVPDFKASKAYGLPYSITIGKYPKTVPVSFIRVKGEYDFEEI